MYHVSLSRVLCHDDPHASSPYMLIEVSAFQDFVAGTMAGVALTLVGHPFDTVKVRMQVSMSMRPYCVCM